MKFRKWSAPTIEIDEEGDKLVLTQLICEKQPQIRCQNQASKITQIPGDEKLKNTAQALKNLPPLLYLKYFDQRATKAKS